MRVYSGPSRSGGSGNRLIGAAFGHAGAEFFLVVALAAVGLGTALFKPGDLCRAARVDFSLGLNQIEGVGEQLGRFAEGPALDLALDSLLDGVVEGDSHGMSIRRERGGGKQFLRHPAGFALACGSVDPTHRAKGCAMNGAPGDMKAPVTVGVFVLL